MKPLSFLALAALSCLFLARIATAEELNEAALSKPRLAPAWELKDVDGKTVKLSDFAGKVVVLDFWATWCGPCLAELPEFVALQKKYGAKGLAIIGISMDEGGPGVVKKTMSKEGINYPVVMGTGEIYAKYTGTQEGVLPTAFIIDRNGMISAAHLGLTEQAEFEKQIEPLLK